MLNFSYRLSVSAALIIALTGCSLAPGLYIGHGFEKSGANASATAGSAEQSTPPAGRLTAITPQLIEQQRRSRSGDIPAEVSQLFAAPNPYKLGPGDVLNIMVWDHPELAIIPAGGLGTDTSSLSGVGNGYNINTEGQIQFPYVGNLKLSGMTDYQARDLLTARLAKYIKDPQITVRVQSYRSGRVYLDGEVRTPGLQSLNDIPMTLPEAIGRAGGFTPTAERSAVAVTRKDTTVMVNLVQLSERGINPSRILLQNGDLVRVLSREDFKVYVLGEVLRPTTQTLRNGRLSLNEALSDSGGVNPTSGDPRQIFVVRSSQSPQPQIFHLDATSPAAFALAEGFQLMARDVIYVDPVPLVRWNRIISLVLPSAQAVTATRSAAN